VLVLGANDNVAAHFGELSAEWFRARKVRGVVIDGSTRDAASITRLRFPTFVRYRTPLGPRGSHVSRGRHAGH
jgi:regulator of RNase E activity RraA